MQKLTTTGACWCGCGTPTDTYFAPGHDKKAEGRVIMEVFGSVPRFLVAFGYAPPPYDKEGVSTNEAWAYIARQLINLKATGWGDKIALEYASPGDRSGPLERTAFDVSLMEPVLAEGSAIFNVVQGAKGSVVVPFSDISSVYKSQRGWVLRLTGAIATQDGATKYVAMGREEATGSTARGVLRLKELGPVKDAAMAAWRRLGVEGLPALYVAAAEMNESTPRDVKHGFRAWKDFDNAVRMLSFDDPILRQRCEEFVEKFRYADECWFHARLRMLGAGDNKPDLVHWTFIQGYWGDRKGEQIVEDAHSAYVALLRHIDRIVS